MYEELVKKRKEKGYTIGDMAKVIDQSIANYSKKENGKVKFTLSEAFKIADFLDEKVEDIFLRNNFQ